MFRSAVRSSYADQASKRTVPRGVITSNCYTNHVQMNNRETTYNSSSKVYRYPPMGGPGDDRMHVHIRQCMPLTTFKATSEDAIDMMSSESYQFYPMVFGSWNGVVVPTLAENAPKIQELAAQARMYDEYVPFGYAETTFTYNELSQPDTGMTARVAGSFSITNTGTKTLHPGDRIISTFPPCGRASLAKFKEEQRNAHGADYEIAETLTIIEPMNAEVGAKDLVLMAAGKLYTTLNNDPATIQTYISTATDPFARLCKSIDALNSTFNSANAIVDFGRGNLTALNPLIAIASAFSDFQQRLAERYSGVALTHAPPGGQVTISF